MDNSAEKQGEVFDLPTVVQQIKSGVRTETVGAPRIRGFVPGATISHYEVRSLIGFGGMGVIYRAYQPSLERDVAIKVLSPELVEQDGFIERFNREALSLARVNHPGIVAVMDKGEHDGQYYFVMEFVDGVSLRSMIRERPMEMKPALLIMTKVCEALEYAHSQGFVHRDIKPENILIDTRGIVKLADFGLAVLAKPTSGEKRMTGGRFFAGTYDYMAPEQREDSSAVDARADIYALGVVLYETLTGRLPLGRFAPPSQCAAVDPRMDRIVMKMLDRDPARRYRSAGDVGRELAKISASGVLVLERGDGDDEISEFEGRTFYTMSGFLRRMMPVLALVQLFWAGVFTWMAALELFVQKNPHWTYIGCALIFMVLAWFTLRVSRNFFVEFTSDYLTLRPYLRIPWKSVERFYTQEKHPFLSASHVAVLVRYRVGGIQMIRTIIGNPAFLENSVQVVEGLLAYATHYGIPVDEELISWRWRSEAESEAPEPEPAEPEGRSLLRRIPVVTGVCKSMAQYLNVDPYILRIVFLLAVFLCGTIGELRPIGFSLVFLYAAAAILLPRGDRER